MTQLSEFAQGVPGLSRWNHPERIKFFAWFIHSIIGRDRFNPTDIRACYDELHIQQPADVHSFLRSLQQRSPKEVLRDGRGYYLERRVREQFDDKYGQRPTAVQVDKILQGLPAQVPDLAKRTFLNEALICFRTGAFRAAIVMTWNLAFDHLCHYVLKHHLATFNTQLPRSFPKAHISTITKRDNFAELKESEILQVCKSASIITADVYKILKEKLDRRNSAAHPSSVIFTQLQAEDFITDLVMNVVIKFV